MSESSKQEAPESPERREVLRAVAKYSAIVAGSSAVVLSAKEALAGPLDVCSKSNPNPPSKCFEPAQSSVFE